VSSVVSIQTDRALSMKIYQQKSFGNIKNIFGTNV